MWEKSASGSYPTDNLSSLDRSRQVDWLFGECHNDYGQGQTPNGGEVRQGRLDKRLMGQLLWTVGRVTVGLTTFRSGSLARHRFWRTIEPQGLDHGHPIYTIRCWGLDFYRWTLACRYIGR